MPTLISDLKGKDACSVGCGQYHTLVAMENGDVYGFGRNECGQLGCHLPNASDNYSKKPVKIPNFKSVKVACGYYHSVAISQKILYSWGKNDWGQLGLRTCSTKEFHPQKVKFIQNQHLTEVYETQAKKKFLIKDVVCGCYHTVALSIENNIYTFGRNSHGQLGNSTTRNSSGPIEIRLQDLDHGSQMNFDGSV